MNKFIQALDSIDTDTIRSDVDGRKIRNSQTLNISLQKIYPDVKATTSKALLFKIWDKIIEKAAIPRKETAGKAWIKLFKAMDEKIKALYSNENTSESIFTQLRKVLRKKYGDDSEIYKQSIYNMGISQARSRERKEEYAAKVKERNTERGQKQPLFVEDILAIIQRLKKSNNPYEQALAVLLATGSRSVELFKISKYHEVKEDPEAIDIEGISKDNGNRGYADITVRRPLVGLLSHEVVGLVDNIRKKLNLTGPNVKISSATNTVLNKAFKIWIQPLAPEFKMTAHKCRYIYGNVAYLLYGKPQKIPYESFVQTVLTHSSGESTKSYLGINIQFKEKVLSHSPSDLRFLFEKEIKQLREHVNRNCPDKSDVDLAQYRNSFRKAMNDEDKIAAVVAALKALAAKKMKVKQSNLRSELGYSAAVMTSAYKRAREQGII